VEPGLLDKPDLCYIGIDPGTVRCGVAAADPSGILASPLGIVPTEPRATLAERVARILGHRWVKGLVVGLPLNERGAEGQAAFLARQIGELLADGLGVDAVYLDERFTSREAVSWRREARGETRRGKHGREEVDAFAAAAILQGYLDRLSAGEPAPEP
jgi:putative holliday junction resolvase